MSIVALEAVYILSWDNANAAMSHLKDIHHFAGSVLRNSWTNSAIT